MIKYMYIDKYAEKIAILDRKLLMCDRHTKMFTKSTDGIKIDCAKDMCK